MAFSLVNIAVTVKPGRPISIHKLYTIQPMKLINKLFLLIAIVAFSSCVAMRPVNTSQLRIGMTKDEVQNALRKKPESTIAAKKDPVTNRVIEVVQYREMGNEIGTGIYWLYFVNDRLDRWELANPYGPAI